MSTMFFILTLVAGIAVLGVLFAGTLAMAKGGEFNEKYGNAFMRWRVILQAVALGFFALAVLTATG